METLKINLYPISFWMPHAGSTTICFPALMGVCPYGREYTVYGHQIFWFKQEETQINILQRFST